MSSVEVPQGAAADPRAAPKDLPKKKRLIGIDAARGLALIGLMAIHLFPSAKENGEPTLAWNLFSGDSAALFALLAGRWLAPMAAMGTMTLYSVHRIALAPGIHYGNAACGSGCTWECRPSSRGFGPGRPAMALELVAHRGVEGARSDVADGAPGTYPAGPPPKAPGGPPNRPAPSQ
jgi:hypothetical protein